MISTMGKGTDLPENKSLVTNLLSETLRTTRHCSDLVSLEYRLKTDNTEIITAHFNNGYRKQIDVTADSGWAMIKDVMRALE